LNKNTFTPKLFTTLKGYTRQQFTKDLLAGVIVGIVALPLAIAFAIASGVSPEKGLYTAIIAGFIVSAMGGSKVQIGGPTGAFIVIVYGIVQEYGVNGLIIATFLAGILLVIMGLARLGAIIKFIPHPLIVGFTTGIALIIFSSQVKDFLGLSMGAVPADFLQKWAAYAAHFTSANLYSILLAMATIVISFVWPRFTRKIPGSLFAILVTTAAVYFFKLPVETIGSKFGAIPSSLPHPAVPQITWAIVQKLIRPAFTIALLGGIESLLSAVVADGMTGGNHRSNMELVAQGVANMFSAMFGGIPATGAIARTATNIKNGGRTPIAGIIHAIVLLLIMLFVGKWAALIPMATLSGILIIVAYNMSEWRNFLSIIKGPRSDAAVLVVTFLLTVLVDLTVAIEIGMVLAVFLFMAKMTQFSSVKQLTTHLDDREDEKSTEDLEHFKVPKGAVVYEINGPLFFGAAYKFKDAIRVIADNPRVLIVRMRNVPIIDATGIRTLLEVEQECIAQGTKLILSEITNEAVLEELKNSRLLFMIGKANVVTTLQDAINRSQQILNDQAKI
jgi:sulfate permease, SulP family